LYIQAGVVDPGEYTALLDEIMGKKFVFRVNWQSEWKQCSVLACLDGKIMVDIIERQLQNHQVYCIYLIYHICNLVFLLELW
jgi:hypothetical protein